MEQTPQSPENYPTGKRVAHFILGFFGFWIFNISVYFIFLLFFRLTYRSHGPMDLFWNVFGYIFLILILLLNIIFTIIFLRSKRRYIGIGILCGMFLLFLIPLLVLGACFLAFSGGGFF